MDSDILKFFNKLFYKSDFVYIVIFGFFTNMVEIKKAGQADISLINKLGNIAFTDTYAEILTPDQIAYMLDWMYSEKSLNEQLEQNHVYYIGYLDGVPFGYLSVQRENQTTFHLQKIYLLKEFQKKGLGELLFQKAISHVEEMCPQPCRMILNVNRNNSAKGFYEKMGMQKIDEGNFPIGNGYYMNDYIMGIGINGGFAK